MFIKSLKISNGSINDNGNAGVHYIIGKSVLWAEGDEKCQGVRVILPGLFLFVEICGDPFRCACPSRFFVPEYAGYKNNSCDPRQSVCLRYRLLSPFYKCHSCPLLYKYFSYPFFCEHQLGVPIIVIQLHLQQVNAARLLTILCHRMTIPQAGKLWYRKIPFSVRMVFYAKYSTFQTRMPNQKKLSNARELSV